MTSDPLPVSPVNDPAHNMVSQILAEIQDTYQLDLSQDPAAMQRIEGAVDQALVELAERPETEIKLPFISANAAGPIHYAGKFSHPGQKTGPLNDTPAGDAAPREEEAQQARVQLPDQKPLVTIILLVLTIIIYASQLLSDQLLGYDLPAVLGLKSNELILSGQYWRLFTPMFLHGSVLHLGFNMYALYILGSRMERFFGPYRFLGLYLLAGITGNIFSFIFTTSPSLGSSTAIFGLLGAEGVFIYQHQKLFGAQSRTALRQIIQVAAINLLIGLSPGIDNWGHVGGLIGGGIFAGLSGPLFQVLGDPPELRLENTRSDQAAGLGYLFQLLITSGLAFLIILSKR